MCALHRVCRRWLQGQLCSFSQAAKEATEFQEAPSELVYSPYESNVNSCGSEAKCVFAAGSGAVDRTRAREGGFKEAKNKALVFNQAVAEAFQAVLAQIFKRNGGLLR